MINYKILAEAVEHYEALGYKYMEAPWTVTPQISAITKPKDRIDFEIKHNEKVLVASGEQSFLYLMVKGYLPPGSYQTITPCFRYEQFDEMHGKYFMKNELIITDDISTGRFHQMVEHCVEFFEKHMRNVDVVKNEQGGLDIVYQGHELGSYGIREHKQLRWIYGTGCAEPRLSRVMQMYKPKIVVNVNGIS